MNSLSTVFSNARSALNVAKMFAKLKLVTVMKTIMDHFMLKEVPLCARITVVTISFEKVCH